MEKKIEEKKVEEKKKAETPKPEEKGTPIPGVPPAQKAAPMQPPPQQKRFSGRVIIDIENSNIKPIRGISDDGSTKLSIGILQEIFRAALNKVEV